MWVIEYIYQVKYAKKKYGQHFLINMPLIDQIANYISEAMAEYTTNVLEVGPGRGALTQRLAALPDINLKVIEVDPEMVSLLKDSDYIDEKQVIEGDLLKSRIDNLFEGEEFLLVGNFPYNISSQIVIKMLTTHQLIPAMIGMFQREMADRILSENDVKSYSKLTVLTQAMYSGKRLVKISPGSFNPPPRVESMVIRLDRKPEIEPIFKEKYFRTVVGLAFGQRRKMLRNTLKSLVKDETLQTNPYFTLRPEQLTIEDFGELTQLLLNQTSE